MIPSYVQYVDSTGRIVFPQHSLDGVQVPRIGEVVSQQGVAKDRWVTSVATVLRLNGAGAVDFITYMVTLGDVNSGGINFV